MEDEERCELEKALYGTHGLADIKTSPEVLAKIKWDVTPQIIMEPRFQSNPEHAQKLKETAGYMFYIESQCEPPALMLMKVGGTNITSTVGKIDEISPELVRKAMENPEHPPSYGMYAITEEIKAWLKKELGV